MKVENNPMAAAQRASEDAAPAAGLDAPWRAAPLGATQLADHARRLAARHRVRAGAAVADLLALLATNADAIGDACGALEGSARAGVPLPPAAVRLLDAIPLFESQVRLARGQLLHDARRGAYRLPRLDPEGEPRAWRLALDVVAHGDGALDPAALERFLTAYGETAPLSIAELDALPALLRMALIDNLRRLAQRAARVCAGRAQAAQWAQQLAETAAQRPGDLLLQVADMVRSAPSGDSGFVAELARRLQGRGAPLNQVLEWLDARLADDGAGIAQLTQRERAELADDAVSAGNSLASLRLLGGVDWTVLAETLGAAEQALRADPDGSHARMDAATRAHYRHAVERLARRSGRSEIEVAREAVALAGVHRAPGEGGLDGRTRHVGYYLAGPGCAALAARLGSARSLRDRMRDRVRSPALPLQVGATALLALAFVAAIVVHAQQGGAGLALMALIGILALPGAGELARALVRMMRGWLAPARPTPRMRLEHGIPPDAATIVAVCAQLNDAQGIAALCAELEVRYLGNRDRHLRFCLLADLPDAREQHLPSDDALCDAARAAIEALNRRHEHERSQPFMLLVRARSLDAGTGLWIGRERQRGQLADLNAWLCGARERFFLAAGNTGAAAEVRYVISLDADTGLDRDAARSLVAAMTHPLHLPLQGKDGRVNEGHGMLRVPVRAALPLREGARYARLWPDGARSWAAIHDVDAWRRALGEELRDEGRAEPGLVEEDRLRARWVSDLRLEARHVGSYGEHVLRRHRALRAAWQETRRLERGAEALRAPRQWWRLFDRLRAGLVAPTLTALLVLCWSTLAAPAFWSAAVLAVFFVPALAGMLVALADRPHDAPWRQHLDAWARGARAPLVRAAFSAALLPYAAWYAGDALVRGLWRRNVTRRHLLELRPPALARSSIAMENNWRSMWFAPLLAVGTAVLLTFANPYGLFAAAPLLLVWFLAPVLAWWASQPARRGVRLASGQTQFLRALARRTWAFFERHDGAAHGLAPQAVLEHPEAALDERVSPAGMGLSLLAGLGARDFGFIPLGRLVERSEKALMSMALLERWHGHLFGWYDGATLAPVEPARVDTAASGSLVLALRTFAAGLDELPAQPIAGRALLDGIRDTLNVARQHATAATPAVRQALDAVARALQPERCRATDTLPGLADCLRGVAQEAGKLAASLAPDADPALIAWSARLSAQCEAQLEDLFALAPWVRVAQEYVLDARLTGIPTLHALAGFDAPAQAAAGLAQLVEEGRACARERIERIAALARDARALAQADFGALHDPATGQLSAGWQVDDKRLASDGCDLLASNARMACFAAVAQDQLDQRHWWSLGRPLRMADSGALLLSRHGALADYLAPQLVMPSWRDTLLGDAARAVVRMQAIHARRHGVLWGFSQSLCNAVDAAARYRFRRFGLPAAGLLRAAPDDLVAAPYAAALALEAAPALAAGNLERMAAQGLQGEIGMYEAIDYAPQRLPQGERQVLVRAYDGPHQAMTLLALARHLLGQPMQRRFCADPALRAALGLLQEAPPASGAAAPLRASASAVEGAAARPYARVIGAEGSALPEVQLLSNGRMHLTLDSDGIGATRWEDLPLTRTRRTGRGESGMTCHVRDVASGRSWTSTMLPKPDQQETIFTEGRASLRRVDGDIETWTDVAVAPDHDVELRRIRIVNHGKAAHTLELTSCVALAGPPPVPGMRSGIRVEFDAASDSLLCVTAPDAPVVVHRMTLRGVSGQPSFETSRARFIGRGHDLRSPQAVTLGGALPGLDPEPDEALLALRRTVTLAPGQEIIADLVLGAASSRAIARELALRYGAGHLANNALDHAIEAAWTHGQAFLHRLELGEAEAQLFTRLAGCLLHPRAALRAEPAVIARNVRGREALASYGVGSERPILLLQLAQGADSELARQLLQAHACWRSRGLAVDLLVLCENRAAREELMHLAAPLLDPDSFDSPGGVHLHLLTEVPQEDRLLLRASAHVLLSSEDGELADRLRRAAHPVATLPPPFAPRADAPAWNAAPAPDPVLALTHDNGIGGFTPDGCEYVIRSAPDTPAAPAPWVNVLANAAFGSVVSERGHAASWSGERAARISGCDDALAPQGGEAFYLRDEDSGMVWSPTPWPAPSSQPYLTRHGFGYSVFEHRHQGIGSTLRTFVPLDAPLRYTVLTLRNDSDAPRRLSATGYVDWLLDDANNADATTGLQVVTEPDLASGALLARNAFGAGFADKVAFFHVDGEQVASTCDREEFVGRHGDLARPEGLKRAGLSGRSGAALDPCAALQVALTLAPGETRELVFVLGVAGPASLDASRMVQQHGGAQAAGAAWDSLRAWWDDTLGAFSIASPEPSLDLRLNGWLPYQAYMAMMGERCTATRLQSALALLHARPELLRAELLRAARDFASGDPAVEDFLWLPFALTRYVTASGDLEVLSALPFGDAANDAATRLAATDDLYLHCVHGLRGSLRFGTRGLPPAAAILHDQTPGGQGESVRLAFFMTATLQRFAELADRRGDFGFATTCRGAALALGAQCEEHGWDGDWYRWCYLESGNVLGAAANPACRVDLLTQGWAVLAGAPRALDALQAATRRLADDAQGAVALCEPAVDGHWAERVEAWPGQEHRALALAALGFARLGDAQAAWRLARLLDPLARGGTPQDCARYAAPPYFVVDGVRTIAPYPGRAIGACFTSAAAWSWLALAEGLLGVRCSGSQLTLRPRLAPEWDGLRLCYRHHGAIYEITMHAGADRDEVLLDGQPCADGIVPLGGDRRDHRVEVRIAGAASDRGAA
ncbi:GH36-type glycosyl hydrolase domain-containing protein [Massilia sp. YIM B02443]|uniref:GH36-type glycosyl hydrolase domain-containing protein n=1 Tax=Massilia sp. YIM B02443 TaxID=3050127 RepID=UPI0025B6D88C|nr:hypothetical protein [Massilia sp. YIM B02443]MDN4039039.1 hypothetical protein [Massilia sp. YIM B02443]